MLFPTFAFGLFFLATFAIGWGARGHNEWRKLLLLVLSWVFYGAWDWAFVPLLMVSALGNWLCAWVVDRLPHDRAAARLTLWAGVLANLGLLVLYKYWAFLLEPAIAGLKAMGLTHPALPRTIVLPVGVSFFTFQGMSYLIDVWRGRVRPARLLDLLLLMSFFAHLVAGPIVRARDLVPQFERRARITRRMAALGLLLVLWGLFKKAVIASELATRLVDPVFLSPGDYGRPDLLAAVYGYAVQIYCDFSAYSDMAIGVAALLGYRFPENFNQPYRAASLQDFWRRWHISLSSWLRDYLYIPLGGNRSGLLPPYGNLAITMLLGGLWHGANVTFLIWGGLHGAALGLERAWQAVRPATFPPLPRWVGVIATFHIVCLAWVFFRAPTFGDAIELLRGLAGPTPARGLLTPFVAALILLGLATQALSPMAIHSNAARLARLGPVGAGLVLGLAILVVEALRAPGVAPFIYYQF